MSHAMATGMVSANLAGKRRAPGRSPANIRPYASEGRDRHQGESNCGTPRTAGQNTEARAVRP
jgi:hypothetical protein